MTEQLRETTVATLAAAGFSLPPWDGEGVCERCGCESGPHRLVASFGDPRAGGLYYCQNWPECDCTGTWSTPAGGPGNGGQVGAV